MGAMFRNDERPGLGQVEHLSSRMRDRHRSRQPRPAVHARRRIVIDHGVRCCYLTQSVARMTLLAPRPLARSSAQALDPSRLLQPVAGWRLAAVAAVETEPVFQIENPSFQRSDRFVLPRYPLPQHRILKSQHQHLIRRAGKLGSTRAIPLIRGLSHRKLDSQPQPSCQVEPGQLL